MTTWPGNGRETAQNEPPETRMGVQTKAARRCLEHPGPGTGGKAPMQTKRNPLGVARQSSERTRYPGISKIHARGCGWRSGRCSCEASYQASAYSARERKKIRRHFDTLGAARTWRDDAAGAIRQGRM